MPLRFMLLLIALITPLRIGAQPVHAGVRTMRLDGRWWRTLQQDEKWGYVEGHDDCWVSDAKNFRKRVASVPDWIAAVDDYYAKHPADQDEVVHEILNRVDRPALGNRKPLPGAEVWTEPHGYLDGLWWRGGSPISQSGYLEGYLCRQQITGRPPARFSKSIVSYRNLITDYVAARPSRDDEKLANILYRFRDR
jgi:hypothetical protein